MTRLKYNAIKQVTKKMTPLNHVRLQHLNVSPRDGAVGFNYVVEADVQDVLPVWAFPSQLKCTIINKIMHQIRLLESLNKLK